MLSDYVPRVMGVERSRGSGDSPFADFSRKIEDSSGKGSSSARW